MSVIGERVLGPGQLDDFPRFFKGLPVAEVDLGFVGKGCAHAFTLGQGIYPPVLVAPSETHVGPATGDMIQHGHVLGNAQRVVRWQNQGQLPHFKPGGL